MALDLEHDGRKEPDSVWAVCSLLLVFSSHVSYITDLRGWWARWDLTQPIGLAQGKGLPPTGLIGQITC